ncbi:cation:H+ antiporter [Paracoccus halophilus]|uniref:Cation:H+ antiporter n=1 Tax=Paracoccus halophilus TaxID=376733 RepID=A0A099F5T9_9RHOB|nr:calcium/sodium antiporter [Paracoccus halophilus]KGJ05571.1 sodium:proton exchanger [Paracoccus halophilus]SFA47099.1 cation:H+ antiporter [Paracoccus halophilus]
MIVELLLILFGLAALVTGGEFLVRGAVGLSLRLGLPALIVGLTVVAFGTSAPEMIVSVAAVLNGSPDIALGNVIGSNIANILLVLGLPALVSGIATRDTDLRESWVMMIAASILLIAMAFMGPLGRPQGAILLAALATVLWRQITTARQGSVDLPAGDQAAGWRTILLWLLIGLIALPVGGQMLVAGATDIARQLGISEAVIGLTLVAVGTSLPELATSVIAALRGRADLALGNVIGSNIFNILSILGVTALIGTLPVPAQMLRLDLWIMLAAALLPAPFLFRGWQLNRLAGAALLGIYAIYLGMIL